MTTNVIKQIVKDGQYGSQTIKMVVRSNERGPKGDPGDSGVAATISAGQAYSVPGSSEPAVINSGTSSDAVFDFYIPRTTAAWGDMTGNINAQTDLVPYLNKAETAVQPDDINYTVMQDLSVDANASTSVLQLDADKVNLKSGDTSTKYIPLPVASTTQAGVMNSALYDTVMEDTAKIDTILNGMVAVAGLPSSPTQAQLTTAWETATGLTELINFARMLDIDNNLYWTYYTNTETWYSGTADIQVTVAQFTNSSAGTILGSTTTGQVYAEGDGTGSVVGWDNLSAEVANNTANKLASANLTVDSTLDKTVTGSGSTTAINLGLADGAVTTDKLADGAITPDKIDLTEMKRWVPDYASKSSTNLWSSGTSATASQTGFVYYEANYWASNSQTVSIRINNKVVDKAVGLKDLNNNYAAIVAGTLPVTAGDVISISKGSMTANSKGLYFIPGKWV